MVSDGNPDQSLTGTTLSLNQRSRERHDHLQGQAKAGVAAAVSQFEILGNSTPRDFARLAADLR